jgi:hypothetical protein
MFRGEEVLEGRFRFLHCEKTFEGPCRWKNPEFSYLWDFNLHYFEYLSALEELLRVPDHTGGLSNFRATPETGGTKTEKPQVSSLKPQVSKARRRIQDLMDQWIAANPCPTQPGWHPYPISLRAINWIKFFVAHPEFAERPRLESLYAQMLFLEGNLEGHLQANHLLENGRALLFGGLFFEGRDAERWLAKGLSLLKREIQEQYLPNGGHFERSPMYHCILVEGLLDTCVYLESSGRGSEWLQSALEKMCAWTEAIRCPDGTFPLFNDAALGISADPDEVIGNAERMIAYRRRKAAESVRNCDAFYVLDAGAFFCAVDGAPIGPSYNPGHAHSDNFTYELFFRGKRLVADAGTFSYDPGPSRQLFRSTRAHNTVLVNDLEQSEVWGGFRVARRSNPHLSRAGESGGLLVFQGAYRNQAAPALGIVHERLLVACPDRWVLVWDTVEGRGDILAENNIYLGPGWSLSETGGYWQVRHAGNANLFFQVAGVDHVERATGEHAPEFGKSVPVPRIILRRRGKGGVEMGYLFSVEVFPGPLDLRVSRTAEGVELCLPGFERRIRFEDLHA